jgi:hypothetical protein
VKVRAKTGSLMLAVGINAFRVMFFRVYPDFPNGFSVEFAVCCD